MRTIRRSWKDAQSGEVQPREIWYEIGSTSHEQDMGFKLPRGLSGFPNMICIEAVLAETLIAEGVLWIRGDVDEEQTHCYYTGLGSYYEKNKAKLVPYVSGCIARRRREILTNHVAARLHKHGAEIEAQATDVVEQERLLLDYVRKGYQECHLVLPSDETILAEIKSARIVA